VTRLALIADPHPAAGYPAGALLADALREGWDAYMLGDSRGGEGADFALTLARAFLRRPAVTLRAVRPGTGPPRRELRAQTAALRPHLLHLPSSSTAEQWLALAGRVSSRTLVAVGSDDLAAAFDEPQRFRRTWEAADALHVESDVLAALLREHGIPAEKVFVVPPAADPELLRREPPVRRTGRLHILSVGELSWTQGYEHAIAAVRLLGDRGIAVRYRIVGRGSHEPAVNFARHELGVADRVEIVDPAAPGDPHEHLRWSNVLVDAATAASSPTVILDAHAAGVPIVSATPADDGRSRVLAVAPFDPEALADAIARLAEDEALRARLAHAGREDARALPGRETQVSRLRALHRRLVDRA
jgi:glycosyltransferase involved in cell wall biosynthesis